MSDDYHECSIRDCEDGAIIYATVEFPGEVDRTIHLCRTHLPLGMGGAIFREHLKEDVLANTPAG